MPRPTKKAKSKGPRPPSPNHGLPQDGSAATALAEPPPQHDRHAEPAPEPAVIERPEGQGRADGPGGPGRDKTDKSDKTNGDKDRIAASLNIAKLQGMSMTELNQ